MSTYVVTSFDFGGSSAVKLHVVTDDADLAGAVYTSVLAGVNNNGDKSDFHKLVELTQVAKDTTLDRQLYWGDAAKRAVNNNQ
jgi:hypothetical protein